MACDRCGCEHMDIIGSKLVCPKCSHVQDRRDVIIFKTRRESDKELEECLKDNKRLKERNAELEYNNMTSNSHEGHQNSK